MSAPRVWQTIVALSCCKKIDVFRTLEVAVQDFCLRHPAMAAVACAPFAAMLVLLWFPPAAGSQLESLVVVMIICAALPVAYIFGSPRLQCNEQDWPAQRDPSAVLIRAAGPCTLLGIGRAGAPIEWFQLTSLAKLVPLCLIDRGTLLLLLSSAATDFLLHHLDLPGWPADAIALLAVAQAGRVLLRFRGSLRWASEGRCPSCGYRLLVASDPSPDTWRCPECGEKVAQAPDSDEAHARTP